MSPERMRGVMLVSAAIGVIALASAGVFGMVRLIQHRRGTPEAPSEATAAVAAPQVPFPNAAAPLPPPAYGNAVRASERTIPPAPRSVGTADLSVRIVATGIVTGGGAGFTQADIVGPGERPAVEFTVMNVGTAVSERWQFTANLPTLNGRFVSDVQQPLAPGEGRRYTLGFGELLREGENSLTVSVFPWSGTGDARLANDAATAFIVRGY